MKCIPGLFSSICRCLDRQSYIMPYLLPSVHHVICIVKGIIMLSRVFKVPWKNAQLSHIIYCNTNMCYDKILAENKYISSYPMPILLYGLITWHLYDILGSEHVPSLTLTTLQRIQYITNRLKTTWRMSNVTWPEQIFANNWIYERIWAMFRIRNITNK